MTLLALCRHGIIIGSLCSLGPVKDKLKDKPKQKDFLRIKLKKKRRRKKAKFGKGFLKFGFCKRSACSPTLSLWKWLACKALSTPVGVVVELLRVGINGPLSLPIKSTGSFVLHQSSHLFPHMTD